MLRTIYRSLVEQGMPKGEAIQAVKQLAAAKYEFQKQEAVKPRLHKRIKQCRNQ